MAIGKLCVREVAVAKRNTTIHDAARVMRQFHVGDLVVVDDADGRTRPVGIITDRDVVLSVVATGLDPTVFTVGDLVNRDLVTVHEQDGVFETIQKMRSHGIRRMPVVDSEGALVGIISVDDLVQLMAEEMAELGKLIAREQAEEVHVRR